MALNFLFHLKERLKTLLIIGASLVTLSGQLAFAEPASSVATFGGYQQKSKNSKTGAAMPTQAKASSKAVAKVLPQAVRTAAPKTAVSLAKKTNAASRATTSAHLSDGKIIWAADSLGGAVYAHTLSLPFDRGFVVVPWTFVAEVTLARNAAHFFVDEAPAPGKTSVRIEARLVDIDLGSDLALFRLDHELQHSFTRTKIRADAPERGEALAVLTNLGQPQSGAHFLSYKNEGPVFRYLVSLGDHSGAIAAQSANYLFDRFGRLVAVTSYSDSAGIANSEPEGLKWAAPGRAVLQLLQRQDGPRPASIEANPFRRQLEAWQSHWTRQLIENTKGPTMRSLDCQPRLTTVADSQQAALFKSDRSLQCTSHFTLPLGAGYGAGLTVWAGEVKLESRFDGSDAAIGAIETALSAEAFKSLESQTQIVNLLSPSSCESSIVANHRAEKVRVRYCTSALKTESGFNDSVLSVASMQPGDSVKYTVVRLKGFTQANSRVVLAALVDHVGSMP